MKFYFVSYLVFGLTLCVCSGHKSSEIHKRRVKHISTKIYRPTKEMFARYFSLYPPRFPPTLIHTRVRIPFKGKIKAPKWKPPTLFLKKDRILKKYPTSKKTFFEKNLPSPQFYPNTKMYFRGKGDPILKSVVKEIILKHRQVIPPTRPEVRHVPTTRKQSFVTDPVPVFTTTFKPFIRIFEPVRSFKPPIQTTVDRPPQHIVNINHVTTESPYIIPLPHIDQIVFDKPKPKVIEINYQQKPTVHITNDGQYKHNFRHHPTTKIPPGHSIVIIRPKPKQIATELPPVNIPRRTKPPMTLPPIIVPPLLPALFEEAPRLPTLIDKGIKRVKILKIKKPQQNESKSTVRSDFSTAPTVTVQTSSKLTAKTSIITEKTTASVESTTSINDITESNISKVKLTTQEPTKVRETTVKGVYKEGTIKDDKTDQTTETIVSSYEPLITTENHVQDTTPEGLNMISTTFEDTTTKAYVTDSPVESSTYIVSSPYTTTTKPLRGDMAIEEQKPSKAKDISTTELPISGTEQMSTFYYTSTKYRHEKDMVTSIFEPRGDNAHTTFASTTTTDFLISTKVPRNKDKDDRTVVPPHSNAFSTSIMPYESTQAKEKEIKTQPNLVLPIGSTTPFTNVPLLSEIVYESNTKKVSVPSNDKSSSTTRSTAIIQNDENITTDGANRTTTRNIATDAPDQNAINTTITSIATDSPNLRAKDNTIQNITTSAASLISKDTTIRGITTNAQNLVTTDTTMRNIATNVPNLSTKDTTMNTNTSPDDHLPTPTEPVNIKHSLTITGIPLYLPMIGDSMETTTKETKTIDGMFVGIPEVTTNMDMHKVSTTTETNYNSDGGGIQPLLVQSDLPKHTTPQPVTEKIIASTPSINSMSPKGTQRSPIDEINVISKVTNANVNKPTTTNGKSTTQYYSSTSERLLTSTQGDTSTIVAPYQVGTLPFSTSTTSLKTTTNPENPNETTSIQYTNTNFDVSTNRENLVTIAETDITTTFIQNTADSFNTSSNTQSNVNETEFSTFTPQKIHTTHLSTTAFNKASIPNSFSTNTAETSESERSYSSTVPGTFTKENYYTTVPTIYSDQSTNKLLVTPVSNITTELRLDPTHTSKNMSNPSLEHHFTTVLTDENPTSTQTLTYSNAQKTSSMSSFLSTTTTIESTTSKYFGQSTSETISSNEQSVNNTGSSTTSEKSNINTTSSTATGEYRNTTKSNVGYDKYDGKPEVTTDMSESERTTTDTISNNNVSERVYTSTTNTPDYSSTDLLPIISQNTPRMQENRSIDETSTQTSTYSNEQKTSSSSIISSLSTTTTIESTTSKYIGESTSENISSNEQSVDNTGLSTTSEKSNINTTSSTATGEYSSTTKSNIVYDKSNGKSEVTTDMSESERTRTTTDTISNNNVSERVYTSTTNTPDYSSTDLLPIVSQNTPRMQENRSIDETTESQRNVSRLIANTTTSTMGSSTKLVTTIPTTIEDTTKVITTTMKNKPSVEGPQNCITLGCPKNKQCLNKNNIICLQDYKGNDCSCKPGCRLENMYISIGQPVVVDRCGNLCYCSRNGLTACTKIPCGKGKYATTTQNPFKAVKFKPDVKDRGPTRGDSPYFYVDNKKSLRVYGLHFPEQLLAWLSPFSSEFRKKLPSSGTKETPIEKIFKT